MKETYLEKITDNFPGLRWQKSELITSGWDDDVIILDKKIVFSFPKNKLDCYEKFQREAKILPLLNKYISLTTPNYIYIPKDKSFAGYKYILGVPFTNQLFNRLDDKQKLQCAKQIAKFLSELHNFSVIEAKKNEVTTAWTEQDARPYYIKRAQKVFKRLGYDFQALKILLDKYPMKKTSKLAVVHQDFTDDHIMFDTKVGKIRGVIDFGDVQIADPAIDFSKLWNYGEQFLDMVLHYYKIKDNGLKERSLRWWIYHNISLVVYGHGDKMKDMWETGYKRLKTLYKF